VAVSDELWIALRKLCLDSGLSLPEALTQSIHDYLAKAER